MTIQENKRRSSKLSWHGQRAVNPVRAIVESPRLKKIVMAAKANGKDIIKLSIGDPTIFKNLKPPEIFINAIKEAANDVANHGYLPSNGKLEAREAVAKRYSYKNSILTSDDVILASGCSGSLEIVFKALLNQTTCEEKRSILIPSPSFPLYETHLRAYDLSYSTYMLYEDRNWEADLTEVDRQLESDRSIVAILFNNPSNPLGTVYSKEYLIKLLKLARKWGIVVVSDEIYGDITFSPNKFHPIASLTSEELSVPVISVGGIAKEYITPGFRLGWILFYSSNKDSMIDIRDGAKGLSMLILGPNSLVQAALPTLLSDENKPVIDEFKAGLLKLLETNATLLFNRLNAMRNTSNKRVFDVKMSQGTMYCFIKILDTQTETKPKRVKENKFCGDSVEFMERLLEEQQVFVLPGKVFGETAANMFRVTLTPPTTVLDEVCDRIQSFVTKFF